MILATFLAMGCVENIYTPEVPEDLDSYQNQILSPSLTYLDVEENQALTFIIPTRTPIPMVSGSSAGIVYSDSTASVEGIYNVITTKEGLKVATKSRIEITEEPQTTVGYIRKEAGGELYLVKT